MRRLEERTLLSFSNLGFSLPDLTISGEAGPRAAWGGPSIVSAYLQNIGASTTTEPLSQAVPTDTQAAGSLYSSASRRGCARLDGEGLAHADSQIVERRGHAGDHSRRRRLEQNNVEQLSSPFTLPSRPERICRSRTASFTSGSSPTPPTNFPKATSRNNLSKPVAVQVTGQPLPELRVIGLAVPSRMQPGDTIAPTIVVENFGHGRYSAQGPVTVDLVESVTKSFTLGSQIVATYTIDDLPGVSGTPTKGNYRTFASQILAQPENVVSMGGNAVTLSTSPNTYFLGVVVDPQGAINQLSLPKNSFQAIHVVGPPIKGLPPATPCPTAPPRRSPPPRSAGRSARLAELIDSARNRSLGSGLL